MSRLASAQPAAPTLVPRPGAELDSLGPGVRRWPWPGLSVRLRRVAVLARRGGLPLVWILLSLLAQMTVWVPRLLPLTDLPGHLSIVRGWHSFYDPQLGLADHFSLDLQPVPYLLYYALVHQLMYLVPIEIAGKVVLSAYLLAFPLGILALSRAFGRSPWLALGGFPLAFSPSWSLGFLPYLVGLCCFFFALAAVARFLAGGRPGDLVLVSGLTLLTYFGHALPWACLGLASAALVVVNRPGRRRTTALALAMAPSLVLGLSVAQGTAASLIHGGVGMWWDNRDPLGGSPFGLLASPLDLAIVWPVVASLALLFVTRRARPDRAMPLRGLAVVGLAFLLVGSVMPTRLGCGYLLGQRVVGIFLALALLLPCGAMAGRRRLLILPTLLVAIIVPIYLTVQYRDFSQRNLPLLRFLDDLPQGAKAMVVAGRGFGADDPVSRWPAYVNFRAYPMVFGRGVDPTPFANPFSPLIRRQGGDHLDRDELAKQPGATDFDYFAVRDSSRRFGQGREVEFLRRSGAWSFYARHGRQP